MAKSKLKAALQRQLGVDPKKEKQVKISQKKSKKRKYGDGDDSDEAPELVDSSFIEKEAESGSEEEEEVEKPVNVSTKKGEVPTDLDAEDSEAVDEDADENEYEEEDDVPLSDIESENDYEVDDILPHQKLTIDNHAALTSLKKRIALPISELPFAEHMSVTASEPVEIKDVDDDLKRELAFYKQALDAAREGRASLTKERVPFSRPVDYFAEMMKDDDQMGKIKGKLLEEAEGKKRSQEARKQRDLKKFGKQVQVAKQQERDKAKREMLDKVKTLKRKRQGTGTEMENDNDPFDIALDNEVEKGNKGGKTGGRRDASGKANHKRQKKDEKYGHGGKKKYSKSGDAMSSGDLSGFSVKRNKAGFGGPSGKKKTARPGKSKRSSKR